MTTVFPGSLDALTNPTASDDTSTVDHAAQHANANDAIEALEAKVGVNSSAVTSSLDYKVSNAASVDPGHKHTTAGLSITGTPDGTKFLKDDGSWSTPPTTTVATTSVTGTVKVSTTPGGDATAVETGDPRVPTQNENDALVGTSGTAVSSSNKLVDAADVSAAAAADKIVRATGTALPALSGANLTNIPLTQYYAGTDSVADGVGNVTNTKTIGFQPKIIHYIIEAADSNENQWSWGTWTATPTYQTIGAENSFAGVYRSTSAAMANTFTDGSMTITIGNVTSTGFDITYQRTGATWSSNATVSFTAIG